MNDEMSATMFRTGLVALGAKPAHVGHVRLIEFASSENDYVLAFVSLKDRRRKGEFPVSGDVMHKIWLDEIERVLPKNVIVLYDKASPVGRVYEFLGDDDLEQSNDSFTIYADSVDANSAFSQE